MISYITQVSICWSASYLLYFLWLRNETFFNANRVYLLVTLLAGLILPLIEFQLPVFEQYPEAFHPAYYLETITVTANTLESNLAEIVITPVEDSWSLQMILLSIYWLGVLFFAGRFFYGIFQILRLAATGKITRKSGYTLVETNQVHLPFSFMDYLFWSEAVKFKEEEHEKILHHELCHIKGKHSIDVLITEILSIFLWCSPLIFMYKSAIKNIHEFLADEAVLKDTPTPVYGRLLLRQSRSGLQIAQANNFIHSQLKKRILMMTKTRSEQYALLKYIAMIPLLLFLVFSISAKNTYSTNTNLQAIPNVVQDSIPESTPQGDLYKVVEEMPRYPGCENEPEATRKDCATKKMLTHIYKNIKYPAEARKAGIEGTVVTSFIVEKDGSISNTKIKRTIGGGCDEEVLRVVASMPKFIPGKQKGKNVRVEYMLPVKFKLEGGTKKADKAMIDPTKSMKDHGALIILDGKEVPHSSINQLSPNNIERVDVLKGEAAIKKYGKKGKDGVVLITTIKSDVTVVGYGQKKDTTPVIPPPPPPPPAPESGEGEVFMVVEKMPMFPGATDTKESNKMLIEYVAENLIYPKEAKDNNVEGVVVVSFVVTKKGYIKDAVIKRSIGAGTDEEVLRVVGEMNKLSERWTPGYQRGVPVNVQFNLPVKFKMDEEAGTKE